MEGRHGHIPISEFEEIFKRNAYAPWQFRFYWSRWGPATGAPADTCTLIKGCFTKGDCINIPVPDIPEQTVMDSSTGRIIHRGWRALLKILCADHWIKPSEEIERLLGPRDYSVARKGTGCY